MAVDHIPDPQSLRKGSVMNVATRRSQHAGRLASLATIGAMLAALLPAGQVATVLGAGSILQAATNVSISADTSSAAGGSSTYTTLPDLIVQEGSPGDISSGSLTIAPPTGFAWKASGATLVIDQVGAPGTPCGSLTGTILQSTSVITIGFSRVDSVTPCLITVGAIQVIPTQGTPLLAVASIVKGGTATGLPGSGYGTLATVVGPVAKLGYTQQPSSSPTGVTFLTQPRVATQDAVGNTVTTATASITLTLVAPSLGGPGTLAGCTSAVATSSGIASFSACRVTGIGVGYKLLATDTTGAGGGHPYTAANSALFDISDNLGFETQPGGGAGSGGKAQGGVAFASQPKVTVRVASANFTTNKAVNDSTTVITLSIKAGTGTAGAVLTCDQAGNLLRATAGSSQFTGCKINKSGTGYVLVATSSPAYGANAWSSVAFDVLAGPATKLTFITQPAGAAAGQAFTTQPVVAITDAGGNVVTSGVSANVSLTIGTNPGVPAGVLSCTPSITVATATSGANAGKAVFSGCRITNSGVGYTLNAIATNIVGVVALASTTSDPFTVTAPGAQITVSTSAKVITWGQFVTVTTAFATNGAGKTFTLQGTRDGVTWSTLATLTTGAGGTASFLYKPATNLYYKAVFAGTADLLPGTSNSARTVVRQIALLRPTNGGLIKSIARNTSITFTTTVRPSRPELPPAKVTFRFYRLSGGAWTLVTSRDVIIDVFGKAATTFKFTSGGSWYVRSIANPTSYNANSVWSPLERYNVR